MYRAAMSNSRSMHRVSTSDCPSRGGRSCRHMNFFHRAPSVRQAMVRQPISGALEGWTQLSLPVHIASRSTVCSPALGRNVDELSLSVDDDFAATPLRVAYQGVPGAYSEMAALKALPDGEPYPCAQFETAFQTVSQWMADRAVLPVENSLGGSIHTVYDLLLRYRLHIVGETSVAVDHCLLALPGVEVSDLKRAISHPQALAQCDGYLRSLGVVREAVDDTAGAAMEIAKQGWRDTAAVASSRAADLYGLERLDTSIQDNKVGRPQEELLL